MLETRKYFGRCILGTADNECSLDKYAIKVFGDSNLFSSEPYGVCACLHITNSLNELSKVVEKCFTCGLIVVWL